MSESAASASRPTDRHDGEDLRAPESGVSQAAVGSEDKFGALQVHLARAAAGEKWPMEVLDELRQDARQVADQNQRLAQELREARGEVTVLRAEIDRLSQEPGFGIFLRVCGDGTVDVFTRGSLKRVHVSPAVDTSEMRPGQRVVLDEAFNVVLVHAYEAVGEVVTLQDILASGDRALVLDADSQARVVKLAEHLKKTTLHTGDSLLLDRNSGYVFERLSAEVEDLFVEEVPDINYERIGGLAEQIQQIRDAVELPYLHSDLFERFRLRPPNGILLYGPPGCGKTMLAKAMAHSLARQVTARTGKEGGSHFLGISVQKLLNKYVGETERHIRLVFRRARETASDGMPVIVFFDEMDSIFRMRRSGEGAGLEDTTVPQLLTEIDDVESLRNVIVVGASNRADVIDPAILRPGRLDVKIRVDRPDAEAAADILAKHFTADVPVHRDDLSAHDGDVRAAVANMVRQTVHYLYAENESTELFEVTYASGGKEILYFHDFSSGVTMHNIVNRAKLAASRRFLESRQLGLRVQDLRHAAAEEIMNIEDFFGEFDPDDRARISGKRGERIVFVRTLTRHRGEFAGRSIEVSSK
jgi:proteasome-associated ATPase